MPTTFRKVSCCPAKEASGRSSAVAEDRTAKLPDPSASRRANSVRIAASRSAGKGAALTHPRISSPACERARTSSVSSDAKQAEIRSDSPLCCKNCLKASAVVAKPPGTRTPEAASWLIISPREAFLPPTDSTSVILRCSNGTTRAVARFASDMGKLRDDKNRGLSRAASKRAASVLAVLVGGGRRAWGCTWCANQLGIVGSNAYDPDIADCQD